MDIETQYDKIYRYCYFKIHSWQIAEDLTQETFLHYFKQTTYMNRGKPLAYLYTIARNLCNDYYAKHLPEPLDEMAISENYEDDLLTSVAIKQSLQTLPKDIQELILLKYVNDLSVSEICSALGLSRFVVYRRIKSGLKELKFLLREEDF